MGDQRRNGMVRRLDDCTRSGGALCGATGKLKYVTRCQAVLAKRRGKQRRGIKLGVYQCDACGFWHLTSAR